MVKPVRGVPPCLWLPTLHPKKLVIVTPRLHHGRESCTRSSDAVYCHNTLRRGVADVGFCKGDADAGVTRAGAEGTVRFVPNKNSAYYQVDDGKHITRTLHS
jgi:hypothetical protein